MPRMAFHLALWSALAQPPSCQHLPPAVGKASHAVPSPVPSLLPQNSPAGASLGVLVQLKASQALCFGRWRDLAGGIAARGKKSRRCASGALLKHPVPCRGSVPGTWLGKWVPSGLLPPQNMGIADTANPAATALPGKRAAAAGGAPSEPRQSSRCPLTCEWCRSLLRWGRTGQCCMAAPIYGVLRSRQSWPCCCTTFPVSLHCEISREHASDLSE